MPRFEHVRHQPPQSLDRPRELILVACPLRSSVNLSRMVRLAGCCGVTEVMHGGSCKIDREITRDACETVTLTSKRTIAPVVRKLKAEGFQCVGLEQTTGSVSLYDFQFERRTALVIGSEREGLSQDILNELDAVVEIPVYGAPASYNVVTATTMAVYEYCKQFPKG